MESKLYSFVSQRREMGFAWGINDCNVLCLAWLDELTGLSLSDQAKGKYNTAIGAARFQTRIGKRLSDEIKAFGGIEIPQGFQQEGDFLIVENEKWDCGHISLGRKLLSAGPETGCTVFGYSDEIKYKVYRVEICHK